MKFTDFELSESIQSGLKDIKYEETTPIQEQSIPIILEGKDLIGAAQTGTGKTGAFVIPIMQKILENRDGNTQALILTPTRELARQIDEQIFAIGYHSGIHSATVIGGSDFGEQARAIRAGVDIIVATPGRLLDQMNVLQLDFSHIKYLVLDEADRMLDMGFLPDVTKIVESLPKERQTLLFSATMADEIEKVVKKIMRNPERVELKVSKPVESVEQRIYFVDPKKKLNLLEALFDDLEWDSTIIFTKTKRGVDELERLLKKRGVKAVSMHGDRSQDVRNSALRAFKNREFPVMVATDVLARGIDIDKVSVIINYNVPANPDDYIHRIGRTGRYDQKGMAITFVTNRERKYYDAIRRVVGDQIEVKDPPESFKSNGKETGRIKKRTEATEKEKGKETSKSRSSTRSSKGKDADDSNGGQRSRSNSRSEKSSKRTPRTPAERRTSSTASSKNEGRSRGREKPARAGSKQERTPEPHVQKPDIEIVEKAVSRNKRYRKPSKGIWGIIKSFIPSFKR
ncbi:MAG: DEAD/DEAH box helicase [Balneolaceae bacterium]